MCNEYAGTIACMMEAANLLSADSGSGWGFVAEARFAAMDLFSLARQSPELLSSPLHQSISASQMGFVVFWTETHLR